MEHPYSDVLVRFIQDHPSVYHVIEGQRRILLEAGYEQLLESQHWTLREGGKYFLTRNHSALIAFQVPKKRFRGFMLMASHSDSPALKVKEDPEITVGGLYKKLNVELYGGALLAPWLDRPLSVAGRLLVRTSEGVRMQLVNVDRDLLLIPSLAIHMNRSVNDGYAYKVQRDLLPLYGAAEAPDLTALVAETAGISPESVIGHDLFVYNRQAPSIWGADREFMSSPRLDDLQCAFACFKGFLAGQRQAHASMFCLFDNEEVGSLTRQGAASTFLRDTLERICESLGMSRQAYLTAVAGSLMVSADNAHAVHPAHPEKSDPGNRPYLNEGIVLKYNAAQNYCTDGLSGAMFKDICRRADVPYQVFTNRSDRRGGSTLGNLSTAQVPFPTVDLGLPQLAMHAPYEMAGTKDTLYLKRAMQLFFA